MDKIIDANENKNPILEENTKNTERTGAIPKIKYQNNNNLTNLQENSSNVPHINQCHNNKINGCSLESKLLVKEENAQTNGGRHYNQNIILQNNFHLNGEQPGTKAGGTGDNGQLNRSRSASRSSSESDSFDNLSLNSENGLIEEIILLPNNAFSEDEVSINSDDCVYAYVGGVVDAPMAENNANNVNNEQDDETDFLEMDFDPEPNSEVENDIDNLNDPTLPAVDSGNSEFSYEPSRIGDISMQNNWKKPESKENRPNDNDINIITNKVLVDSKYRQEHAAKLAGNRVNSPTARSAEFPFNQPPSKNTGATPKIPSSTTVKPPTLKNSQSEPSKSSLSNTVVSTATSNSVTKPTTFADDENCLECTENEFLLQNKQNYIANANKRHCGSCGRKTPSGSTKRSSNEPSSSFYQPLSAFSLHSRTPPAQPATATAVTSSTTLERTSFSFSEDNLMQSGRKTNESEDEKQLFNLCASKTFSSFSVELNDVLDKKKKKIQNSVTIYSVNCDEGTILEALELIGIKANVDIIRQYFEEIESKNSSIMSIPEYILHISKRHCNYKRIIDVIRSACPGENIDVSFYPLEPFAATPDMVPVHSTEIATRWSPDTNLREISTFKNRHFHRLNVLGKIVNIIRQPANGQQSDIVLLIPQYYKSGYINIIKKI